MMPLKTQKHKAFEFIRHRCKYLRNNACRTLCVHKATGEFVKVTLDDLSIAVYLFHPERKRWLTLFDDTSIKALLSIDKREYEEKLKYDEWERYYNDTLLPQCLDLIDAVLLAGFKVKK